MCSDLHAHLDDTGHLGAHKGSITDVADEGVALLKGLWAVVHVQDVRFHGWHLDHELW